jgi:hypothetical protein
MSGNILKKVFVLGIGGHGWQSIKQFLIHYKGEITLSMIPADWGGSTGVIGRTFEYNDGFLNQKLHNTKNFPILPFGDFTKFIGEFIPKNKYTESNPLYFRSYSLQELQQNFNQLSKILKLDSKINEGFINYLKIYQNYNKEIQPNLDLQSATSLGNIWHCFLFFYLGDMQKVCKFYKQKNIIPTNIEIIFSHSHRNILIGQYQNANQKLTKVTGEDQIDICKHPINPESMLLVLPKLKKPEISKIFLNHLKNSDLVIIPNGSIANWLPLVNTIKVKKILQEKSKNENLLMIMNLFFPENEFPNDVYSYYLKTQKIFPVMLAPNNVPERFYYTFIKNYRQQGKNINYNLNTQAKNSSTGYQSGYNNCLDLITSYDDISIQGLKHDQNSVRKELIKYIIYLHFTKDL